MENSIKLQPVISEKSYALANAENKYTFEVDTNVTKIDIKNEVSRKYKVKVLNVNVVTQPGKMKRDWIRRRTYRRQDTKKAIVKLKKGDKIEEFLNI
ncbi:MAG: 50S ribosomal protein L23 [candidate division WS6 bacterium GW2011_GWF2_39_15]|uniref:Large ribosomal subunit protein uL23 n=1 Tax=candidate division WS6 bacterium GW2011_GWF2_39_15 TaxID=1619100 RepID=A0A0G0MR87_9BACT|nr:MAG: 50S ribosomal protein L23 [candidate division WS6 bacterium GW2011_GWF2_39_15]